MKQFIKIFLQKIHLLKLLQSLDPRINAQSIVRNKIKQAVVKKYAKKFNHSIFIETGTYKGDMINAVKHIFSKIHSIELSPEFFKKAQERFSDVKNVYLYYGDSSTVLREILKEIKSPVLFWLDAHYSKGLTARGKIDTPILEELTTILNHQIKTHTILVDDARCFNGTNDYPPLQEVEEFIKNIAPHYRVEVSNDIITITNSL